MATRDLKRWGSILLMTAAVGLGGGALLMLWRDAPDLANFGRRHVLLLGINAAAAAVLLLFISLNLGRLVSEYVRRAPGARLRGRLVAMFIGLTLLPLAIVYIFAVQFLNAGIDSWFDRDLEQEISTSLRLSRESLDVQARSRLRQTTAVAAALAPLEGEALARALGVLRADGGAVELTVFDPDRSILATSALGERFAPRLPDDALTAIGESGSFVALEPESPDRYQIRTAVRLPAAAGGVPRYLQGVYPVGDRQSELADAIQDTYMRFSELRYLREPLKDSLAFTLFLVLLLALLASAGGALFLARRLVAPLQALVAGTQAVAQGDLDTRLPGGGSDEIGFLIRSFNIMTGRLNAAREESRQSQEQLERARASLAAILARLTTGVIAVGPEGSIRIANDAAGELLGFDLASRTGLALRDVAGTAPLVAQLLEEWAPHMASPEEWRGQVTLQTDSRRRILNCASSPLPAESALAGGAILVFDDVTELLQAQREAAWGEVARRLAHEINNPLTPIRLAAERIRRRYLPAMAEEEGQVLDRSTHTIVQQVEAMRDMVMAFSDYARAPSMNVARVDLNQLVREVAWLYRGQDGHPAVSLNLGPDVGEVEADAVRVRQLLHNLIRNSQEALEGRPDGGILLETRRREQDRRFWAELAVSDNGPGIEAEALPRIFEPYITTKKKGTGLGLAIVKKLVEEHGGVVQAENLAGGGARITVRLPAPMTPAAGGTGRNDRRGEPRREQA